MLAFEKNAAPIKLLVVVFVCFGVFQFINGLRVRAIENSKATQGLLFRLVDVVSEKVRPFSEVGEVDALLLEVQTLIDQLPSGDRTDPRIVLPRARAFITLAEIQWERGNIQNIHRFADLALNVLNGLKPDDLIAPDAQELLARGTGLVGLYYSEATTEGDKEKALDHFQNALGYLERLEKKLDETKQVGADWRWLRSLAQLRQEMGIFLLNKLGRVEEAEEYYAKSLETWKKLKQARPTHHEELDYELARSSLNLGDIYWAQGRKDEAHLEYAKARAGIQGLGAHLWRNLKWPHFLSIVQNNIGLVLRSQGRYQQAIDSFKDAQKQLVMLVDLDSSESNWSGALAWTYDNIGETRVRWARARRDEKLLQDADEKLQHALEIRRKLIEVAKENARWQADFDITRANILAYNGTKKELSGNCISAADDFLLAARTNPKKVPVERADEMILRIVEFNEWGGRSFRNAGRAKDAERIFNEALEIANHYEPVSEREAFAHIKEQLKQDLRDSAMYEPGICID
jgi:tetratricopeptide (TPR) repeat protein